MRTAACVLAVTLAVPIASSSQEKHPALSQLATEFSARSETDLLDADGPLVRDRLPLLSDAATQEEVRWATGFQKRLDAIPERSLSHDDWITLSLLRWEAELTRARGQFYWHEGPIAPYSSPLRTITSGFAAARLGTDAERQRYLDGLNQLVALAEQIHTKLRGQLARGIVLPAAQVDAVVPFIRTFAATGEKSPFAVAPSRLEAVPSAARATFADAVHATIADRVSPAFARLAAFVAGAYRARATDAVGVGRLPDGDAYYRFLIRLHTGLDLTPQQIHDIGLQEVARLEQELDKARQQAGFKGTLAEFRTFLKTDARFFPTTPEQIGERLMAAAARIEPKLTEWFIERPKAPYGAKRLSFDLEPVMTYGYYQMPTPQLPTGNYLFNGSKLDERSLLNVAALSYHELVPGHHFQVALRLENDKLSRFRKTANYTVYLEGWGEYASDLAGEMGMYSDPYDRAGRLSMDLFLSTRLVVDTGMNALGWTRDRAMAYMREHTFESETQIGTETLRYSSDLPGQALAYKLGSRGIRDLRERMRARLGPRFDVRRFHQAVLGYGAMPLNVLEQHVERMLGSAGQ
jgi:uncharacterized protein (DUF885 family)